jgi:hypothetical protein
VNPLGEEKWRQLIKDIVDDKYGEDGPNAFQSKQELRDTVEKYCRYDASHLVFRKAASLEKIAYTYGYPMDKWDVSQLEVVDGQFIS